MAFPSSPLGLTPFSFWTSFNSKNNYILVFLSLTFQLQEQLYFGISFINHNGLQDLYGFNHNIHGQWNRNIFSLNGPNLWFVLIPSPIKLHLL
jgi:hypothetical protein